MRRQSRVLALLIFVITCPAVHVPAQRSAMFGEVVDVLDGKTVVLQAAVGRINVELQFIDVPAAGEPMNVIVRDHLRGLVMGKNVEYRIKNILKDRSIGRLTVGDMDISQQMLRRSRMARS